MDPSQFATAYALSTSVGLKPFLTLALAALAIHFGYLHPSHPFAALGSDGAAWLLGGLAVLEFAGDKIPAVDHALHVVGIAAKPIAAAVLVGTALPDTGSTPDIVNYALMGLGAANALGVHAGVATLRGASTATTLGAANPFISLAEDGGAVIGVVLAFALPFVAAALALALTVAVFLLARSAYRVLRGNTSGGRQTA